MKKYLGQHFLINKAAAAKIVAALDLKPNEIIIEIGPGKGALTLPLAEECQKVGCKIIGIEKDTKLAEKLRSKMCEVRFNNFDILEGDVLKILTSYFVPLTSYKIVGNIPYYITGKLLRTLSELGNKPELTVLMLQKEVAERIVAKPPHNNLLAAATQFWAEPKILFTLKPKDFNPPPKVESAVIKLTTNNKQPTTKLTANYYKLLHIIFKQPRKTILNNLLSCDNDRLALKKQLLALKIDPAARPQNLSLNQIKTLCDQMEDGNQ